MHFYWRVMEELKYLGETLVFHDPCLAREYNHWLQKNAASVALAFSNVECRNTVFHDFPNLGALTSLN